MSRIETLEFVNREGRERLYPSLGNSSYLVLSQRRQNFASWLSAVPGANLRVLDVGGRIQPYRPLIAERVQQYVAIDLAESPLVAVRANACELPFPENCFDLVFCTQVLEYVREPAAPVREIHRVLKPGGVALFSFAAFYPRIADDDYWRFTAAGLRYLLRPFGCVDITPEGSSISGFFRACAVCLSIFTRYALLRGLAGLTIVPLLNLSALSLEKIARTTNDQATGNYSVWAQK
ncbi:MAG TPA: class I SAM-dependent methyltransferase [Candidatus Sulfotelmatobacter sp.]|nr:class I SAM-dependent methyltransferase [Candidatus Sulfotelmatobacter sp.]